MPITAPALAFPLKATFRILTLSPEVWVENARGELLLQVKQKLLTLREATTVFADEAKTVPVYKMLADRVIGFRAVHRITRASDGAPIGAVKQDWEYVAGSGDLDECNGRVGVTPEFPKGIYHYYATDTYPFLQRCVKGKVTVAAGNGPPPGGAPPK